MAPAPPAAAASAAHGPRSKLAAFQPPRGASSSLHPAPTSSVGVPAPGSTRGATAPGRGQGALPAAPATAHALCHGQVTWGGRAGRAPAASAASPAARLAAPKALGDAPGRGPGVFPAPLLPSQEGSKRGPSGPLQPNSLIRQVHFQNPALRTLRAGLLFWSDTGCSRGQVSTSRYSVSTGPHVGSGSRRPGPDLAWSPPGAVRGPSWGRLGQPPSSEGWPPPRFGGRLRCTSPSGFRSGEAARARGHAGASQACPGRLLVGASSLRARVMGGAVKRFVGPAVGRAVKWPFE